MKLFTVEIEYKRDYKYTQKGLRSWQLYVFNVFKRSHKNMHRNPNTRSPTYGKLGIVFMRWLMAQKPNTHKCYLGKAKNCSVQDGKIYEGLKLSEHIKIPDIHKRPHEDKKNGIAIQGIHPLDGGTICGNITSPDETWSQALETWREGLYSPA